MGYRKNTNLIRPNQEQSDQNHPTCDRSRPHKSPSQLNSHLDHTAESDWPPSATSEQKLNVKLQGIKATTESEKTRTQKTGHTKRRSPHNIWRSQRMQKLGHWRKNNKNYAARIKLLVCKTTWLQRGPARNESDARRHKSTKARNSFCRTRGVRLTLRTSKIVTFSKKTAARSPTAHSRILLHKIETCTQGDATQKRETTKKVKNAKNKWLDKER